MSFFSRAHVSHDIQGRSFLCLPWTFCRLSYRINSCWSATLLYRIVDRRTMLSVCLKTKLFSLFNPPRPQEVRLGASGSPDSRPDSREKGRENEKPIRAFPLSSTWVLTTECGLHFVTVSGIRRKWRMFKTPSSNNPTSVDICNYYFLSCRYFRRYRVDIDLS